MKATVLSSTPNTTDRTVDLVVNLYTDANVLTQTVTVSIPADIFDKTTVMERVRQTCQKAVTDRSTFPVSQVQADNIATGVSIRIPG